MFKKNLKSTVDCRTYLAISAGPYNENECDILYKQNKLLEECSVNIRRYTALWSIVLNDTKKQICQQETSCDDAR